MDEKLKNMSYCIKKGVSYDTITIDRRFKLTDAAIEEIVDYTATHEVKIVII